MDTITLVDEHLRDGQRLIEQLAADGNPIDLAFWVKTAEDGIWFLYLATDIVNQIGSAKAYRKVYASLNKLADPWMTISEVKLIAPENPIATGVRDVMARHPGRIPTRFGGNRLGGLSIEEAYIYPA